MFWDELLRLQERFLRDSLQQCGFSAATAYIMVKDLGTAKVNALCTVYALRTCMLLPFDQVL